MIEVALAVSFAMTLPVLTLAGLLLAAWNRAATYRLQRRELELRWLATLHIRSDLVRDAPAWIDRTDPGALLQWAEAQAETESTRLVAHRSYA